MSTAFNKLQELLTELPGIGPRQARRFASFLIRRDQAYIDQLLSVLTDARSHMKLCRESYAYFYSPDPRETVSPLARDPNRDSRTVLVVEKDIDLENIERTASYHGSYFVLGGTVPLTEHEPARFVRARELRAVIKRRQANSLEEVILGLSANPEGEHTAETLRRFLGPLQEQYGFRISTLGRGLATGTELEYSDEDTIKNALENRR